MLNRLDDLMKWSKIFCTDGVIGASYVLGRQFPALAFAILQAKLDRFANILERLLAGSPLANAPRNNRAIGNDKTVFARRPDNG